MDKYHIFILIMFTIVHINGATASTDLSVGDIHRTGDDLSVSVLNNGTNTTARLTVYAIVENRTLIDSPHPYPAGDTYHCNMTWNITHPGAVRMRIHLSEIELFRGKRYEKNVDRLIIEDENGTPVRDYHGSPVGVGADPAEYYLSDIYTPWVSGGMIRIILNITAERWDWHKTFGFCIDEYDVYESGVPIYDGNIDFWDYELKSITFPTDRDYIVAIVDEENNINETNETNNELTRKLSPEITEITFDPETPLAGDNVTISAGVRNPGVATTTEVLLRIDDVAVANTTLSIAHNETGTAVFHWTATGGCHNITIVTGDDELDDMLCVYHSDLSVTNLTIEPEDPVMGNPVTITTDGVGDILVYDRGTVPYHLTYQTSMPSSAGHCWTLRHPGADWIRLYFSHLELLGDTRLTISNGTYTESYGYYEAYTNNFTDILTPEIGGDTLHICLNTTNFANLTIDKYEYMVKEPLPSNWSAYPAGPHNITAVVNENESIPELDFTNNRLSKEILVEGCDLSISQIDITPTESMQDGETVEIDVTVRNIGVLSVTSDVSFLVDNTRIDLREITLAAGESTTLTTTWTAVANTHEIRVVADAEDNVSETDETNNELMSVVEVAGADFSVPAITADPETISATIRNTGTASDARIDMYDCTFKETYNSSDPGMIGDQMKTVSYTGVDCVCVNLSCVETTLEVTGSTGTVKISDPAWVVMPGDTISLYGYVDGDHPVHADFYAGPVIASFDETIGRNGSRDVSADWTPAAGSHAAVVYVDPGQAVCETDEENNFGVVYTYIKPTVDFAVTGVHIDPPDVVDGDSANITVSLNGTADGSLQFTLEDHLTRNLTEKWYGESLTITHGSDAIRVHFEELVTSAISYLIITDADDHVLFTHTYDDGPLPGNWCPWIHEKTIHIMKVGDYPVVADIDRYECKNALRDMTVPVVENVTEEITATWQASTGNHTIHAEIASGIEEINATNNCADKLVSVKPSRDPAVLNITHDPPDPENGDFVSINAEIANIGFRHADTVVEIWDLSERNLTIKADNFFKGYTRSWKIPGSRTLTGIGADMTGVHFESIDTTVSGDHSLYVYDASGAEIADYSYCKHDDLWVWGRGDFLTVSFNCKWGDMPEGFRIDGYAHKKLLNKTTVSLGSGETAYMNATMNATTGWHVIEAVIDPEDRIDEINESNNMLCKSMWVKGPDLTPVSIRANSDGKISAVVRNIGDAGAENVTVSFCKEVNYSYSRMRFCGPETERIKHRDATKIRVRFKDMKIYGNLYIKDKDGVIVDEYSGKASDIWTEWVHGDTVKIVADARCKVGVPLSSFEIDRYEYEFEDEIIDLDAGKQIRVTGDAPCGYEEPYNLSVWVDVGDTILESDEDNNNKRVMVYVDLVADGIRFVSPDRYMLCLDAGKFTIDGCITNGGAEDTIAVPVSDFNVTLEVRYLHSDGAVGDAVFNITEYVGEPFYAGSRKIRFEFDPNDKFETGGNYTVSLTVDSSGDVCESSGLYPGGEDNNATSVEVFVHNSSGYTGGGNLINVAQGEVRGKVVYTVGDSRYGKKMGPGEEKTVRYAEFVTDDADDIEFARIFVYWFAYHSESGRGIPDLADVDVAFNGHALSKAGNYSDNPCATLNDYGYGLYSYDVTNHITGGGNDVATVKNNNADAYATMGVHAIGLLVAYDDGKGPLTKYWVNEGADIMMAANDRYPTGLPSGDCVTTASFKGVERNDTENVNAALLTILGMHSAYSPDDLFSNPGDVYEFNDHPVGSVKSTSHWTKPDYIGYPIDFNKNKKWDSVTDYLKYGDNLVEIRSKGNYMMPGNAFLRLIFPPDLNVINLSAPEITVVGAQHSINTTIRNDGRSDAHDFNVTFYIDGKQMVRIPHLDLPAGENMTLHLYNWTPMMLVHVYNLTAAADVLSGEDWTEIETDNNAMSKHVLIEEGGFGNQTGPRGTGGGSNPTGGKFTEEITGRVMQGMKEFLSVGGGGGAGMFSLTEWIMKGAVWLALLSLVCLGYMIEQRSYEGAKVPHATSETSLMTWG